MLRRLTVKRFKSLVDLDVELGRINVFIGANGSGKSNLLEAIGVLGAAAFGRVDDESLLRRGVRPGVPRLYKSAFPDLPHAGHHISLKAETAGGAASYAVTLWNPLDDPSPAWRFKTEELRQGDGIVASRSPNSHEAPDQERGLAALESVRLTPGDPALQLIDELRLFDIHCPNTPVLRGLLSDAQSREPVGLAGGRLPNAVAELLEAARNQPLLGDRIDEIEALIDWSKGFSVGPPGSTLSPSASRSPLVIRFVDRFMADGRNQLTGYDASEGALYVLYCAVLALHPKSSTCLAMDNVDQALNPRLAQRLLGAICRWSKNLHREQQWLMTAHNPAVLDGLPLDDPEVRLFAVDRNSVGHTAITRIDVASAIAKRPDDQWTLSRMWMNGLLGALPNV